MGKLHELLAVEKTKSAASNKLILDTTAKFKKFEYFQGHTKTLKMTEESDANTALEQASTENRILPTTVKETLDYAMQFWAKAEDVIYQKNLSNQVAVGDIVVGDNVVATNVPVDELLGLENRLETLRKMANDIPTLPASIKCEDGTDALGRQGSWQAVDEEVTTKTEKIMVPVILYEATKEHPAQVKEATKDIVVGRFVKKAHFGAATSAQKAEIIARIDALQASVKQARMRANSVEASTEVIGDTLVDFIMKPLA